MKNDKYYMGLALDEARKGLGRTSPNPCVGAVVVKAGRIISRGYHKKAGTPHAEVHALRSAGAEAKGATMYVTLEPCNHTGKTPPCSHAIVEGGVARVVVGMEDPNPLVDGTGIEYLEAHGVEVSTGVMRQECIEINRPFIKHITTSLPLVAMKAGISLDGKITYQKGYSGWLTGPESSQYSHGLRNTYDAILVGIETVLIDDPVLTTRLADSEAGGRDPLRIILDTHLRTPLHSKLVNQESVAPTWIFCSHSVNQDKVKQLHSKGLRVVCLDENSSGRLELLDVLTFLGKESITSVLVEGGSAIHGAMLKENLVDRVHLFYAPLFVGDQGVTLLQGLSSTSQKDAISLQGLQVKQLGNDVLLEGEVHYP